MQTIQDRGYVSKRGQALIPSFLAFAVIGLLERHFPRLVDYDFTAAMENELDEIAGGDDAARRLPAPRSTSAATAPATRTRSPRAGGLKKLVTENLGEIDARGDQLDPAVHRRRRPRRRRPGRPVRAVPAAGCPAAAPARHRARATAGRPGVDARGHRAGRADPGEGRRAVPRRRRRAQARRATRRPASRSCSSPAGTGRTCPAASGTSSLLRSQSPDTLTLEDALQAADACPGWSARTPDGVEIFAATGRYGPYVKRGDDFRSLDDEDQLFTVTLDEALALLAAPKTRQRRAAAPPLREMGADPLTEKPLVIKDGRFGPYVTDGEFNASLRRGQTPEALTIEEAREMLAEKRAKGPAPRKKAAAKKAAGEEGRGRQEDGRRQQGHGREEDHHGQEATAAKKAPAKKAAPRKAATSTE